MKSIINKLMTQLFKITFSILILIISLISIGTFQFHTAYASSNDWVSTGSMIQGHSGHRAILLQNNKVLIIGGLYSQDVELYNPDTGVWNYTGGMNLGRGSLSFTATLLQNGKVLVTGGNYCVSNNCSLGTASAELYDPTTGTWTYTGSMNIARYNHTATLLQNGKVLVTGGYYNNGAGVYALSSAELYDPTTGTWTYTGSMNIARYFLNAVLLGNGKVLVMGGYNGYLLLSSAELYDPNIGAWSQTGSLNVAQSEFTATLLNNGQVLVAGGTSSNGSTSETELYDPNTGKWTVTGSMNDSRTLNTATLLLDGKVLATGGYSSPLGKYLSTAELYDPNTGLWIYDNSMSTSRTQHSATLLNNGQVLVAGGYVPPGTYTNTAELFSLISVAPISVSNSTVQANTAITASSSFTDSHYSGVHTAIWDWGDGTTSSGAIVESNGSGTVGPDSHTYSATGVYKVTLTVKSGDGGTGSSTFQYVSVYDASNSFTGGNSFDNPTSASLNTTGRVKFGISAKYSNSNVLTGDAKMNFKAVNIDFVSTSLTALSTSNGKAYLWGSGTVNGSGNYTFLATGIDGSVVGGNDMIRFQIKDSSGNIIYDSQRGATDLVDPTTPDATGNIKIH